MGGHMAQVASDVFQAPAILFNPAPRVAAGLKLAAAWTLAVPLQVANLLTLGITRKIGNAFNSRGVAGMSRPMTGFWRVIAPRERGPLAGIDETMEWMASVAPVPGNGMTVSDDGVGGQHCVRARQRHGGDNGSSAIAIENGLLQLHMPHCWPSSCSCCSAAGSTIRLFLGAAVACGHLLPNTSARLSPVF